MEDNSRPKPIIRTNTKPARGLAEKRQSFHTEIVEQDTIKSSPIKTQTSPVKAEEPILQNDDETIKGLHFFALFMKNKRLKNLIFALNRLKLKAVRTNQKMSVFSHRLRTVFSQKIATWKTLALRRLARWAASNRIGYLRNKSVLVDRLKLRSLQNYQNCMCRKYQQNMQAAWKSIYERWKLYERMRTLRRNSRLRGFTRMVKSRLSDALDRIRVYALSRKILNKKQSLLNLSRTINRKIEKYKHYSLFLISRLTVLKRHQAMLLEQMNQIGQKQQKMLIKIEQLQQQNNELKVQQEEEIRLKEEHKSALLAKLEELKNKNSQTEMKVKQALLVKRQEIPVTTLRDVYERVYHNLLYFLKYSSEDVSKTELLEALVTPLHRVQMPVDVIKAQNQALVEVIQQYRRMNITIPTEDLTRPPTYQKPYQLLLQQNGQLYCALAALIEHSRATQNDKDFVQLIEDFSRLQKQFVKVRVDLEHK